MVGHWGCFRGASLRTSSLVMQAEAAGWSEAKRSAVCSPIFGLFTQRVPSRVKTKSSRAAEVESSIFDRVYYYRG